MALSREVHSLGLVQTAAPRLVTSCAVTYKEDTHMDINTFAAWGEFLGGLAVVASLV